MRLSVVLCAAAVLASAQADRIEGERIRPHVKFLSIDLLEGRDRAREADCAEKYIAAQFAAAGLSPPETRDIYQKVPLKWWNPMGPRRTSAFGRGPRTLN